MGCTIARHAELMKQLAHLAWYYTLKFKTPEKIGLRLLRRGQEAGLRRCQLRQHFAKLAKLDQGSVGIVLEIAFSQGPEPHKLGVMLPEKIKVGRNRFHGRRRFQSQAAFEDE